MVTNIDTTGPTAFSAIADPVRREILDRLRGGELGAGEIASHFEISRPAIARHVRVLRRAGLVRERREAQRRYYSLDPAGFRSLDRWLEPHRLFWAARLASLRTYVESGAMDTKGDENG